MRRAYLLLFLLLGCFQQIAIAQQATDEQVFRALTSAERFQYIRNLPFEQIDSGAVLETLHRLRVVAEEEKDPHSVFVLQYYQYLHRGQCSMLKEDIIRLAEEMTAYAQAKGLEIEPVVGYTALIFEKQSGNKMSRDQFYAEALNTFDRMEKLGLERFRDYDPETILYNLAIFMYELEDYETMYRYLTAAEPFLRNDGTNEFFNVIIFNYLQNYHQRKKNYPEAIRYAEKIIRLNQFLEAKEPGKRWERLFWQGLAMLDIAQMDMELGKPEEAERYADRGYQLSQVGDIARNNFGWNAEFDALQALIPIKLQLGKLNEVPKLLRRAEQLKPKVDADEGLFRPRQVKYYRNAARYHELRGDYALAMRFTRQGQTLQDSLEHYNDTRKFEKIQQRIDAEKYAGQLRMVESEKELQKWQRNAALVILGLVLTLAFAYFHRLQQQRRLKEAVLKAATTELATLTRGFREKSELAENLRLENERLSRLGERSEYLETLTRSTILTEEDWVQFRHVFAKVHPDFIAGQKALYPDLTPAELRFLVLEKLDLNASEMANMLGISINTVYKTGQRLRKKTGV